MNKARYTQFCLTLTLALVLAACGGVVPRVTPTLAPTRTPSLTPLATEPPTRTPYPTAEILQVVTSLPSKTPAATATITDTPLPSWTPTLAPTIDATPTYITATPLVIVPTYITAPPPTAFIPTSIALAPTTTFITRSEFSPAPFNGPASGVYSISSVGGSLVTLGQFNLGSFQPVLFAQNPSNPNEYAVVNDVGQIFLVPNYANQTVEPLTMTNFTVFHYQITSIADNDKPIKKMQWSGDGTLAMLIDGDKNLDDGVWIWSPDIPNSNRQLVRECWHPAICENIVGKRGLTEWEVSDFEWSPDSGAVLVMIHIPYEGRESFVIAERYGTNPGWLPPLYRFDYATWAPDSQNVIVSGRAPDGSPVFGRVNRYNETIVTANMANFGFYWTQNAAEYQGRIYGLAARGGYGTPLQLIDEFGRELTPPIAANPERVEWSPDNSAVLIVATAGGIRRHWIVSLPGGEVREITGEVGNARSVQWVSAN